MVASKSAGSSPRCAARTRREASGRRRPDASPSRRACRPKLWPAARQASRMSAGTSKADSPSRRVLRAPAISSAPSGEPCALLVPALVGAPKPIVVLQAISVGRSDVRAASMRDGDRFRVMAVDMRSCSSRRRRSARPGRSSRPATPAPSIEMSLLSQMTISLLSFRWPASAIASWRMPSIRQPSPAST